MKNTLSIYLLLWLLFFGTHIMQVSAQSEGDIWYFGYGAGVSFASGSPVSITDGQMDTDEGCATICDTDGNLLFYTDGTRVWNRIHNIMPNASDLMGDFSSAQSAIIIPKPGSDDVYYIFTVPAVGNAVGMRYSELDLSLQGGLGNVTAVKNVPLMTPSCEKVTAIQHANGDDFWVVGLKQGTNDYYAFLVTASGVQTSAVISSTGSTPLDGGDGMGYLRASSDGKWICAAHDFLHVADLMKFDSQTGIVSDALTLTNFNRPYGVEFSPNNQVLYIGIINGEVYQYDLSSNDPTTIANSRTTIGSTNIAGALQLGPDQKIYHTNYLKRSLSVIENPNVLGTGCNYVDGAIPLDDMGSLGLPTFFASIFVAEFDYEFLCLGDSTCFSIGQRNVDSIQWNFGDAASGAADTSTLLNPKHVYSDTGTYEVTMIAFLNLETDTVYKELTITRAVVDLGADTIVQCSDDDIILEPTIPANASLLWQDSTTAPAYVASSTGLYHVTLVDEKSCVARDSVWINIGGLNPVGLGPDVTVCIGDTANLAIAGAYASVEWSTGDTTYEISVIEEGIYRVTAEDSVGCVSSDSLEVTTLAYPDVDLGADTTICDGDEIILSNASALQNYAWSTGASSATIAVETANTYALTATNGDCQSIDSITVTVLDIPDVQLGEDRSLCIIDSILIEPLTIDSTWSFAWSTGETTPVIYVNSTNEYALTATSTDGCEGADTVALTLREQPFLDLGDDALICSGDSITIGDKTTRPLAYQWSTGEMEKQIRVSEDGLYMLTVTDSFDCQATDSIDISFRPVPNPNLGPDSVLCEGTFYSLDVEIDDATYIWQDNSSASSFRATQTGEYSVEVSTLCGTASDTVFLQFENCNCKAYIPNAFSPNDDGINDVFQVFTDCEFEDFELRVFNRWGGLVFMSDQPDHAWNGQTDTKLQSNDTYVYWVRYRFFDQPERLLTGDIHVVR